jgi:hypothetical protein
LIEDATTIRKMRTNGARNAVNPNIKPPGEARAPRA